jgi:hypothetical protein
MIRLLRSWLEPKPRYTASDLTMLRLKIGAGLMPEQANLTEGESRALAYLTADEIVQLAGEAFDRGAGLPSSCRCIK